MIVDKKFKVYWEHMPPDERLSLVFEDTGEEYPFRGKSTCTIDKLIYDESEEIVVRVETMSVGESRVHQNDTFDRKKGMKESLKKALVNAPKEVRTKFWNEFLKLREKKISIIELQFKSDALLKDWLQSICSINTEYPDKYILETKYDTLIFKEIEVK